MSDYVIYTEIPPEMVGEVDTLEELNERDNFFRCPCCGNVCKFSRLTNQYEYYTCISCKYDVKVC